MSPDPTISLQDISVWRPGSLVLRSIELEVQPGEAIAVFGANGSGKTTLLRVVATLLRPSGGSGKVLGALLGTAEVEAVRPRIGLVAHEPALYPNLTLLENLELIATLAAGSDGSSLADSALDVVGLAGAADRPVARSSNGMKRRAEFARMLVIRPDLLLLDEAHVGLDPAAWSLVGHLVSEVTARGGSALVVAHEQAAVRPIVSRAVELIDGGLHQVSA